MRNDSRCEKRGFTLVELIVVLVILAVLAALLVPALTGYIDKANEAAVIAEARSVLTAAQATVTEAYAEGTLEMDDEKVAYKAPNKDDAHWMAKQIMELSEMGEDSCTWWFSLGTRASDLPAAKIAVFNYYREPYYVTYRAVAFGEDSPAGWSEVTRVEEDPSPKPEMDEPPFLHSDAFNPDLSH